MVVVAVVVVVVAAEADAEAASLVFRPTIFPIFGEGGRECESESGGNVVGDESRIKNLLSTIIRSSLLLWDEEVVPRLSWIGREVP